MFHQAESVGAPLKDFPLFVNNPWGAVIFMDNKPPPPEASRTGATYNLTLQYRWESPPFTDAAATGIATIVVEVLDLPPRLQPPEFSALPGGSGARIHLWSQTPAGGNLSESHYRLVKPPRFGSLYEQV